MKPIIRVENLSKQYRIGARQAPYSTLRDSLTNAVAAPFRRFQNAQNPKPETQNSDTIWALKDVNFEVHSGEVVGIIGRNGAGKSTLLKILSRITEPTEGRVDLYGRVGSLLEVGTGFHPELTGRENIYLNGAVLGMKREEIKHCFDEMVAFAEIEKFLDTPVKHYSSGMYMRLAFAVAAHLSPEILLIDEVLAVGDLNFQRKCLGKMEDISAQGRTVLFVSHSMPMILRLCQRTVLLSHGSVVKYGPSDDIAKQYLNTDVGSPAERIWSDIKTAPGDEMVRLGSIRVMSEEGKITESFDIVNPIVIEVEYWHLHGDGRPTISMHAINEEGITLFCTNDWNDRSWWNTKRKQGKVKARCYLPGNLFAEGQIFILLAVCSYNPNYVHLLERDVISFQIIDRHEGMTARGEYAGAWPGVMRPMLEWEVKTD